MTSAHTWTTCQVTVSALALLGDGELDTLLANSDDWKPINTKIEFEEHQVRHDMIHIWQPIICLQFHAWDHGRFTCDISMKKPNGGFVRFVDQDFSGIEHLPASFLACLQGGPLTAFVDHPVFEGICFEQDKGGVPRGPASTIPVDHNLPRLIADRQAYMLQRHPA